MSLETDQSKGKLARLIAILGIVAAALCAAVPFVVDSASAPDYYQLAAKTLLAFEIVALLLGIAGRRARTGRQAIWISLTALVLVAVFLTYTYQIPVETDGPATDQSG